MSLKKTVKAIVPPLLIKPFRKMTAAFTISGSYSSWDAAVKNSNGYNEDSIVEKVKNSLLKVKNGDAVAERDSVLLDEIPYSWPVLSVLLKVSRKGSLRVLDFGGSLGSSYFYYKDWLDDIELGWFIIEQENFVEAGKKHFENETLKFFNSLSTLSSVDVVLLSSVLQYLPDPWSILSELKNLQAEFICIDRTILSMNNKERIAVQKVSPAIYKASYPIRLISEDKLIDSLADNYIKITDYPWLESNYGYNCKGLIFKHI